MNWTTWRTFSSHIVILWISEDNDSRKYCIYVRIKRTDSVLSRSPLRGHYSLQSSSWSLKLCTSQFEDILLFFSADLSKLSRLVGDCWQTAIIRSLQRCGALVGPSQTFISPLLPHWRWTLNPVWCPGHLFLKFFKLNSLLFHSAPFSITSTLHSLSIPAGFPSNKMLRI